ncbi:Na+/H+ antiporter NhaA [Campylobacter sp. JMF_02 ED1]|uniref:Na+/H+ antiporter NhaA n=1 Tax=unclassified Campylobacter TaxID=2593542 RepID=UPI0022E99F1D|nr:MULTISPECIES: Na+/H+ antiporter NhaA [unclassified Campylobacter]MDA3050988.1 Na+/H+ antiporter NhaA [Campylobacter sp. JMF_02 ED1]MDA3058196.1 Na+/H+ antiporter NhaA [Campylobacter sp. VBCF_04 NA7]
MQRIIKKILSSESSAGVILLLSAVFAIIAQNVDILSPYYREFIHTHIVMGIGKLKLDEDMHFWINDFLMAIFFFAIGLELKREKIEGQLRHFSQILLPSFAALGGVMAPAIIFTILNWGDSEALKGWAIPTATDIAFAVGVMALLGKRIPASLKIFVLTLAIMDDLCAILIIALFYSSTINISYLIGAGICVAIMFIMNKMKVDKKLLFVIMSLILWVMVLNSGIHATIAGVVAGFCIPLQTRSGSMLKDMEHGLAYPVNFFILPIFAFANAGVSLAGMSPSYLFGPVPMGIALGLFFGKQFGIFAFSWLLIKGKIAYLPENANWAQLYAVSIICGIGFTMALFVDGLAYGGSDIYHHTDKLAVFIGSIVSGLVGYIVAKVVGPKPA